MPDVRWVSFGLTGGRSDEWATGEAVGVSLRHAGRAATEAEAAHVGSLDTADCRRWRVGDCGPALPGLLAVSGSDSRGLPDTSPEADTPDSPRGRSRVVERVRRGVAGTVH